MSRKIALIEDEAAIRKNYADALSKQGYQVLGLESRQEALQAFHTHLPDLAIIDISLGDDVEGGFDVCRMLRSKSNTLPIIFLTARDSDFDVISGLRLGALFRRIDALETELAEADLRKVGDLSIDSTSLTVEWKEQKVVLTVTEFWILNSLVRIPGHVKNRDQLMQDANIFVDDGTVTSHVKRLRRKFESLDENFDCIETVYGMGYRWKK